MIIFQLHLQRMIRNKTSLLFMLVVPIVLLSVTIGLEQGQATLCVGVVDLDKTPFSKMIIDTMATQANTVPMTEASLRSALVHQRINYGITIPNGYTEQLIAGGKPQLQAVSIQGTNVALPIRFQLTNLINAALLLAGGDSDSFYDGMNSYLQSSFQLHHQQLSSAETSLDKTVRGIGYLVFSMLFLATTIAVKLVEDREKFRMHRVLVAPVSMKNYMAQSIGSSFLIGLVQVLGILFVMRNLFNLAFGPSFEMVVAILALFSLVSVAFGVALVSVAKDARQVGVLSSLLITPMGMLGGSFWPRWIMPEFLQDISKFVPTTWAMEGVTKVITGRGVDDLWLDISVLGLFALIFFLLGSWRKTDIAR